MVSVVSGSGLGLSNSSVATLGSQGALGNAKEGQAGEQIAVNSTNGNLVIQDQDDFLVSLGLNLSVVRTYNSQGQLSDDFGGHWRLGVQEKLLGLTGTLNTPGSTLTRVAGDESEVLYTYDPALGLYVATGASGAKDTLSFNAGSQIWTWTDGATRATETYDAAGTLLSSSDTSGNTLQYGYTGTRLTQITDSAGQTVYFDYDGANLSDIRVVTPEGTQTRTRYGYDELGRLIQVTVDLSPEDSSVADNNVYRTFYSYEGDSDRISTITRSDGGTISFTYTSGGDRVASYTQGGGGVTTVTADPAQLVSGGTPAPMTYDLNGSLAGPHWDLTASPFFPGTGVTTDLPLQSGSDSSGNGFVVWGQDEAGDGSDVQIYAAYYDSGSASWSTPQELADIPRAFLSSYLLDIDAYDHPVITWNGPAREGSDAGTVSTIYAARWDPYGHHWTPEVLADSTQTVTRLMVSVNYHGQTAVTYETPSGLKVAAFGYHDDPWSPVSSSLLVPPEGEISELRSYVDYNGIVTLIWLSTSVQNGTQVTTLYTSQLDSATGTWSEPVVLDQASAAEGGPAALGNLQELRYNGFALTLVWVHGTSVLARDLVDSPIKVWNSTYTLVDGSGNLPVSGVMRAVSDWHHNIILAWVSPAGLAAQVYNWNAGTWTTPGVIADSTAISSLNVAIDVTQATVAFLDNGSGTPVLRAVQFQDGVWSDSMSVGPAPAGQSGGLIAAPALLIHPDGDMQAIWREGTTAPALYSSHYNTVAGYTVQAADTWQTLALQLYGSASVAQALQDALGDPQLTAGEVLTGLPASITLPPDPNAPTGPYYVVQEGASWLSITQALYGTSDANAIAALQSALGSPALTTGLHLIVPATLSFAGAGTGQTTTFSYTPSSGQTDIESPLDLVTTLIHDESGRLIETLSPAVDGTRLRTDYTYDSDGNVLSMIEDPLGLARTTVFEYDGEGNLLSRTGPDGHTTYRYSATHQLLTQTLEDGNGVPVSQTRNVYDGNGRLRFTISATGRVTEYRYNVQGELLSQIQYRSATYPVGSLTAGQDLSLTQMTAWVAGLTAPDILRVDYTYDFRGQVLTQTTYGQTDAAGEGVASTATTTHYVYDQRGQLLETINPRGSAATDGSYSTSYVYDGLGRITSSIRWISPEESEVTTVTYDGAAYRTITTDPAGGVTTRIYSGTGDLIQAITADLQGHELSEVTYAYDAQGRPRMSTDALGNRSYVLYDEAGRKVADITAGGSLTQYVYDSAGELVKAVRYAQALTPQTLATLVDAQGEPAEVPLATLIQSLASVPGRDPSQDQISRLVYDTEGRVSYQIDPAGAVIHFLYDAAGRVTDQIAYANLVSIDPALADIALSDLAITPSADDRHSRSFYDADGRLLATLDASGYLIEHTYDGAGEPTGQTAYATATAPSLRAAGTLDQLRPAASPDDRSISRNYNAQGQVIESLDAAGYETQDFYDLDGNLQEEVRAAVPGIGQASPSASGAHITSYQYDGEGRQIQSTDHDDGTVSAFTYAASGSLIRTTAAQGTADERSTQTRYDVLGRVTAELSAEGSALITPELTSEQIEAIWGQYATHYAYDQAGNQISATGPDGNTTLYFYDAEGRLRYTVNALGEVTETRYNALGEVTDAIAYVRRIQISSLTGGAIVTELSDEVAAIADSTRDAHTRYTYDLDGKVATVITADAAQLGVTSQHSTYNAFGEVSTTVTSVDATHTVENDYEYDLRGQLTAEHDDVHGKNVATASQYDAFGDLISTEDGDTHLWQIEYDALGRQVGTEDPLHETTSTTYDELGRVKTTTDESGTTTYVYNDATRSVTVISPAGVTTVMVNDREGEIRSVTTGGNTTTTAYDANGQVIQIYDLVGVLESRTYDAARHLKTSTDANGVVTAYTYDAAGRVLTQVVDAIPEVPTKPLSEYLQLTTAYTYDGEGRVIQQVEPSGRVTLTSYDADGHVTETRVDPLGLNLRTTYTYDLQGRLKMRTELGQGTVQDRVTQFAYDGLGRKIQEAVGSRITQYRYDDAGNLTRLIDANGVSTWYVYDDAGRQIYAIDALGDVTQTVYDAAGRVIRSVQYLPSINVAALPSVDVASAPSTTGLTVGRMQQTVYDADGRAIYSIDPIGAVTERQYDDLGNVVFERTYSTPVPVTPYLTAADVAAALHAAGRVDQEAIATQDHAIWNLYDVRNQLAFSINSEGGVSEHTYDAAGNLIATTDFATAYPRPTQPGTASQLLTSLTAWTVNHFSADDRQTRFWYDATGRLRFTLDSAGYLQEARYDDAGRSRTDIAYALKPANLAPGATLDAVVAAAQAASAAQDQRTTTNYDLNGRVSSLVDALGNTQSYQYDAVGNTIAYTNADGATWTYAYDDDHHITVQYEPAVAVTSLAQNATTGELTSTTAASVTIQELFAYDAMGNTTLIRTTYGDGSVYRDMAYHYDALGRQDITTYPDIAVYNEVSDTNPTQTSPAAITGGSTINPLRNLTSLVSYDALGYAYRSLDTSGNYSFKAYDADGRVVYEVDSQGYVTGYTYDVFGNQTSLTRYATPLQSTLPANTAQIRPSDIESRLVQDPAADRTITTTYDTLNRALQITESAVLNYDSERQTAFTAGATTIKQYDAFGDLILSRQLVNSPGHGDTYADSYAYYDHRGLKTADIDSLGYITTYVYDAFDNLTDENEYAKVLVPGSWSLAGYTAPADTPAGDPAGYDRKTHYTYDALNRNTTETLRNYHSFALDANGQAVEQVSDKTTTTRYDGVGNVVQVTDAGGSTFTYYDAMGRVIAIAEPSRNVDGTAASGGAMHDLEVTPLIEMHRDYLGNAVEQIQYATSAGAIAGPTSVPPHVASSPNDRVTRMLFDKNGHVLEIQDPAGARSYSLYNARGDIAKEWQVLTVPDGLPQVSVTIHHYDAIGRETEIIQSERRSDQVAILNATSAEMVIGHGSFGGLGGGSTFTTYDWQGTSSLTLSDVSLSAQASIKVQVEYMTKAVDGVIGSSEETYLSDAMSYTGAPITLVLPLPVYDGMPNTLLTPRLGGIDSVLSVRIFGQDAQGNYTELLGATGDAAGAEVHTTEALTQYNSFGEITGQGTYAQGSAPAPAGQLQQYFDYDQNGRLIRSNQGDGVARIYYYDAAGQTTAELLTANGSVNLRTISLTDALALADARRTETVHDLDGRVTEQRQPAFIRTDSLDQITATPRIEVMSAGVPPDAVYQQVVTTAWHQTVTYYQLNPAVGGYRQLSPSTYGVLGGTYEAVPGYQVVANRKEFHWTPPENTAQFYARVEYWPTSNTSAVTTVEAYALPNGDLGINIDGLSGQYGYRITYSHEKDAPGYAELTGTFNTSNGSVVVSGSSNSGRVITPTVDQTADRWGNVTAITDAETGLATRYVYNQADQLTLTILPAENYLRTTGGAISRGTAESKAWNYYDLQGHLIQAVDGNGVASGGAVYNQVGQLLASKDQASGAYTHYVYNIFGEQIQVTDALGYLTRNVYDKDGRLIHVAREIDHNSTLEGTSPAGTVVADISGFTFVQSYGYDEAGRRTTEIDGEGNVTSYWYDVQGNLVRVRAPGGNNVVGAVETAYEYDALDHKVREIDSNGNTLTWTYDAFGRILTSSDLTAPSDVLRRNVTTYQYDSAGELKTQTSQFGQHKEYGYDAAGHLTSITDTGTATTADLNSSASTSTYAYDADGHRVHEQVVVDVLDGFTDSTGIALHKQMTLEDSFITYDALGRISSVDGPLDYRNYTLNYSYDLAGNRTEIDAQFLTHLGQWESQDLYYVYDADNRVTVSEGVASGATVIINSVTGTQLTYDAKGDRTTARSAGKIYQSAGSGGWQLVDSSSHLATLQYQYDGLGRLKSVSREASGFVGSGGIYLTEDIRQYDLDSRVTQEDNYFLEDGQSGSLQHQQIVTSYADNGNPLLQVTDKVTQANGTIHNTTLSRVNYDGYDAAGLLQSYSVEVFDDNGNPQYVTDYENSYRRGASYQQTGQTATSTTTGGATPQPGSTTYRYNVDGELVAYQDNEAHENDRYFASDAAGEVLTAIKGSFGQDGSSVSLTDAWTSIESMSSRQAHPNASQAQYYFYVDGNNVGTYGQLEEGGANFDVNYTPISQNYPGTAPSQVVVQAQDTLRTIAQRVYGDADLWYLIADANGLSDPDALTTGEVLTIPNNVVALHNNATTFKPFDVSRVLGDTTPTQPAPPGPHNCGVFGQILVVAIAIVVTIYTHGQLAPEMNAFVAWALAAAAGSIVSQDVAIRLGVQQKFSWGSVGVAALSAGLTAGTPVGQIGGSEVWAEALQGALSNALSQGLNIAFHLQKKFSWSEVALSAFGNVIGGAASRGMNKPGVTTVPRWEQGAISGLIKGGMSVAVQLANGGKVTAASVLTDAFGNMLGDSLAALMPAEWSQNPYELTWKNAFFSGRSSRPSSFARAQSSPQAIADSYAAVAYPYEMEDAAAGAWPGEASELPRLVGQDSPELSEASGSAVTEEVTITADRWDAAHEAIYNSLQWIDPFSSRGEDERTQLTNTIWKGTVGAWRRTSRDANLFVSMSPVGLGRDFWNGSLGIAEHIGDVDLSALKIDIYSPLEEAIGRDVSAWISRKETDFGLSPEWKLYVNDKLDFVGDLLQVAGSPYFKPLMSGPSKVFDGLFEERGNGGSTGDGLTLAIAGGGVSTGAEELAGEVTSAAGSADRPLVVGAGTQAGIMFTEGSGDEDTSQSTLTATQRRNSPGTATASGVFEDASGLWLRADTPTRIPKQVVDALRGRKFSTFGDLQEAIWKAVGENDVLLETFSQSKAQIKEGYAPIAPEKFQNKQFGIRFNLHHVVQIQDGGAVYDMGNLVIVSPTVHSILHHGTVK